MQTKTVEAASKDAKELFESSDPVELLESISSEQKMSGSP